MEVPLHLISFFCSPVEIWFQGNMNVVIEHCLVREKKPKYVGVSGALLNRDLDRGLPLLHKELWQVPAAWDIRAHSGLPLGMLRDEQGNDGNGWRFCRVLKKYL